MKVSTGVTLVELLIVMAITAILSALAIPSFETQIERAKTKALQSKILAALNTAKSHALTHGTYSGLCPLETVVSCGDDWSNGILIFEDNNKNGRRDEQETTLHVIEDIPENSELSWRGFPRGRYIQFTESGSTNHQNGRFSYCPAEENSHHQIQIIVYKSGRARVARPEEHLDHC